LLVGAGFAFKVAAVPFHMWTPDVYEGAPTPVTALMSAGVKAAAFAALIRVFFVLGEHGAQRFALVGLSALAALTMVGGNLMALPQRNVKRMLAYSSIAHAGYILVGVVALFAEPGSGAPGLHVLGPTGSGLVNLPAKAIHSEALKGVLFYLLAYTVTVMGAFGTLGALERREDEDRGFGWDLDRFSGLVSRRPGWAVAMAVFMLSLGGIPPTVGFMGKLLVFRAAVDAGLWGIALLGVLTSAAGIYYYLRVVVYMFMRPAPEGVLSPERNWSTDVAIWLSTVAVVALGVLPNMLGPWISQAGTLFSGR
jgi:NADH-quinone oxidoreductase subunit N